MGQTMPFFNPDTTTPDSGVARAPVDPSVTQAAQETLMSAQIAALHGAPWANRAQSDNPHFPPLTERMQLVGLGGSNDVYLQQFAFNA